MKTVLQTGLIVAAAILGYLIFKSIKSPLEFERAKKVRYDMAIEKLEDIRKAEIAYREVNGKYTSSWDTLIHFLKTDSFRLVRRIAIPADSMTEARRTEETAIEKGETVFDTIRVAVLDSLFGKSYKVDDLKYVPVPDTTAVFRLGTATAMTASGITVPVFEARAHNNTLLKDLDRRMVINLNNQRRANNKYPGLKVGSLDEPNNNAGNWE